MTLKNNGMNKLPTAKELFDKIISENDEATSTEMMIEFAKLHVEAALKEAFRNYEIIKDHQGNPKVFSSSILHAYPLTNIK